MISRLKKLLLAAIWFSISQNLQAQTHLNAWFRGTVSIPVGSKIKVDAEFQHRRQNGFDNRDMLDKNLMFTFRNWIHYQHNSAFKFSLSPFAYFSNYKIIQKNADETAASNSEIRFSAAVELHREMVKRFYIIDRTAAEYRLFQNNQPDITRLRNRLGFRYHFTNIFKLSVFDEILVNVAGTTHIHFFDQNRMGLDLEYNVLPSLKFDVGYMYIDRLPLISSTRLNEKNIFLNLTYQMHKRSKTNKAHTIG